MGLSLLSQRQGPFFDPFEALDENARQNIIRSRLKAILDFCRVKSHFYSERFSDLRIDFNAEFPLKSVPVLTAAELRENLPPLNRNLLTEETAAYTVFQSGGTTGIPKTSLFTHEEMELVNLCNARGFYAAGLNAADRVANLWAVGGLYMTFVHMNRMLQEYGCMSFPFSNQTPVNFIQRISKLFEISCFTGITSVVLNTLREIYQKDKDSMKVSKIFFGGEHIYETDRKEMQKKFGVQVISAPGYGTVDSWYLGYQCSVCTNGIFHAFDDMVYLEIINEETGSACVQGEPGMLYATALLRRLTPIIRFRVGDRARWLGRSCECNRTTPLFELLGRGDDVLRIGYDSVDYPFVQKTVSKVPQASGRVQMEKRRRDGRDELILRIETDSHESKFAAMTTKLLEVFTHERPSFREFISKGTVWPLQVVWVKPGQLPLNSRTGKLIRVIDAL